MIYAINEDVLDGIFSEKSNIVEMLMGNLLKVIKSNYNFVTLNFDTALKKIPIVINNCESKGLKNTKSVIEAIEENWYETYNLVKEIHPKIIFTTKSCSNDKQPDYLVDINNITHDFNLNLNFSDKQYLVSEDISDTKLYTSIANAFFRKKFEKNSGFELYLERENGGGGNTADLVHDKISDQSAMALVIVDSDKTFPKKELGHTAQKLKNMLDAGDACCNKCKLHILPVHEKENLILPSEYLVKLKLKGKLQHDSSRIINSLRKLRIIEDLSLREDSSKYYIDYYDLKKGISIEKEEGVDDPEVSFFSSLIQQLIEDHSKNTVRTCKNLTKYVNLEEIEWTNCNNHLYSIRLKIAKLIIAFGISYLGDTLL